MATKITSRVLADDAIVRATLGDDAIGVAEIADDAVTSAAIADDVALGGNPTTTTQSTANSTTRIATTAFVQAAIDTDISALIDSAPGTLNTLNEIAAALNDDPSFTTTVNNAIALKAPIANAVFTGNSTFDSGTLYVDSSNDRVGVGTTTPAAPLDVVSNSSAVGIDLRGRSADNIGQLTFESNNSGTSYSQLQSLSTEFKVKTIANIPMSFHTNSNEKMSIGTDGAVTLKPNGITTGLRLQGRSSDNHFYVQWKSNDGSANYGAIGSLNSGALQYQTNTHIFQNEASNAEYMRIDSSGNVGIGTVSYTHLTLPTTPYV